METSYFFLPENLKALKSYAGSLCQNQMDADDLFQDTMLRILENQEGFREGTNPLPWMKIVMRNIFYNTCKSKDIRKTEDLIEEDVEEVDPGSDCELREYINTNLNETLREVFWLVYEGYSYKEISEKLGIPEGTVKSRIFTARNILKPLKHLYM